MQQRYVFEIMDCPNRDAVETWVCDQEAGGDSYHRFYLEEDTNYPIIQSWIYSNFLPKDIDYVLLHVWW